MFSLFPQEWGHICSTDWGSDEVEVICRQLQYEGAESAVRAFDLGVVPEGADPILVDLNCAGSERTIDECLLLWRGPLSCSPEYAAALVCKGAPLIYRNCLFATQIFETSCPTSHQSGIVLSYLSLCSS